MYQGRPVCFDYGWHKGVKSLLERARLRQPLLDDVGSVARRRWGKALVGVDGKPLPKTKKP
jgi:hypothetical protein